MRTITRSTLNRSTKSRVCMSYHPEGNSCGHVRCRLHCLFSMTLLQGEAEVYGRPRASWYTAAVGPIP
jgi:hypothetical protein